MTEDAPQPSWQVHPLFVVAGIGFVVLASFVIYLDANAEEPPLSEEALVEAKANMWEVTEEDVVSASRPKPPKPPRSTEAIANSFVVEAPDLVKLGWGWSQPRAEAIPTVCVEFEETAPDDAQESTIKISEIRDSYALNKEMNISASVSVKSVSASGSGKASFAKKTNISSSSVTYLVSAEVLNAARIAGPVAHKDGGLAAVRLTPAAERLAKQDLEAFQEVCGEGYVAARMTGARAYMVASTKTSSKSDREKVRSSVKGSGWGVKVSAAAKGTTATSSDRFERSMTYYQQGGSFLVRDDKGNLVPAVIASHPQSEAAAVPVKEEDEPSNPQPSDAGKNPIEFDPSELPENVDQAIARIKRLAEAAARAGKTFEVRIVPYQVLENFPRGRNLLAEEDELDEISALWGAYATIYNDLKAILETPEDYKVPVKTCSVVNLAGDAKPPVVAGDLDRAQIECSMSFMPLSDDNDLPLEMVEQFQDMALIARGQIEAAAGACLDSEELCTFDATLVRSPYSVRAGMPLFVPSDATSTAKKDDLASDHMAIHLREPSQGRCAYGARTPGCISNAEMRRWAMRTGLKSAVVSDPKTARQRIKIACAGRTDTVVYLGEANDPRAPTVWFSPHVILSEDDKAICEPS